MIIERDYLDMCWTGRDRHTDRQRLSKDTSKTNIITILSNIT